MVGGLDGEVAEGRVGAEVCEPGLANAGELCGLVHGLQLLGRRPEDDFVDVDVGGLADREGNHAGIGRSRDTDLAHVVPVRRLNVALANVVEELRGDRAGRDHGGADVVGFDFLTQAFAPARTANLVAE